MESIAKKYSGNICWNIGCLFADGKDDLVKDTILRLESDNKYIETIKYVYGAPLTIASSGRVQKSLYITLPEIYNKVTFFNSKSIGVRLTFQSLDIVKDDLNDTYLNSILDLCNNTASNKLNGVIIASDLLYDYVKSTFSNLHIVSSIIKPASEVGMINDTYKYYNKLLSKYDIVVVNNARIMEEEFFNSISDISRLEIIANDCCDKNCPYACTHYDYVSKACREAYLNGETELFNNYVNKCRELTMGCKNRQKNTNYINSMVLNHNDIMYLSSKGITNFKIEGREYDIDKFVDDLDYYIIEDKYR